MNAKQKARFEKLVKALHASESKRSEHEKAWNDYQRLYANGSGVAPGARQLSTSPRNVNLSFQTVEIMVSAAMERSPKIYAKPRKKEAIKRARLAEKVLGYWESVNDTSIQVEEAHRDAAIYGDGFLKSAWVKRSSRAVEPDPEELQKMLEGKDELSRKLGAVLTDRDVYDYLKDMTIQVVENRPMTRRVSPYDIWLDMQAKDYADIAWIAHRYTRPLEDVKQDPGYIFKNRRKVTPIGLPSAHGQLFTRETIGELDEIEVIEIWDLQEEKLYIGDYNALDAESLLYDGGSYPYAIGNPFTHLEFFRLPDQLYSMGVVELIAPLQQEINDIREEQTSARARMRQKFAAEEGILSEDAIGALQSDIEGDVAIIAKDALDGRDLRNVLVRLDTIGVNPEFYNQGPLIKGDIYEVTGITEYMRNGSNGYRSATEVNTVNNFASARLARMVRSVHLARVQVAQKEMGLAAQFMDTQESVRIVGLDEDLLQLPGAFADNSHTIFPFDRRDIAGEYDIELEAGSYDPESKQTRLDRWRETFALLSQFPELDRKQVIVEVMRELGVTDPQKFIAPIPIPLTGQTGSAPGSGTPAPGGGRQGASSGAEIRGGLANSLN